MGKWQQEALYLLSLRQTLEKSTLSVSTITRGRTQDVPEEQTVAGTG